MSNTKVDNNTRAMNNKNGNHQSSNVNDWDDDDDIYDDYDQGRWQKGNQRKVLKFKEHKAK